MPYGLRFFDSQGNVTLDITDRTPRIIDIEAVTVPTTGTVTVQVPTAATTTNSIVIAENGAQAAVTSTGVVTVTGNPELNGNTNLKLLVFES